MKYTLLKTLTALSILHSGIANSATIELVTGSLSTSGIAPIVIPGGSTGQYSLQNSNSANVFNDITGTTVNSVVSSVNTSVDISANGLNISALSDGSFYFNSSFQESFSTPTVSGNLSFNVIEAGLFDFSWNQGTPPLTDLANAQLTLKDSANNTILDCNSYQLCNSLLAGDGTLTLLQGGYTLAYSATAAVVTSVVFDTNMNFTLYASPVPIPAAFWLFISGLIGLYATSKRK